MDFSYEMPQVCLVSCQLQIMSQKSAFPSIYCDGAPPRGGQPAPPSGREATERERNMALQLNNIPEATEKHLKSVELLEKLLALIRERLNELMLGSGDPQVPHRPPPLCLP